MTKSCDITTGDCTLTSFQKNGREIFNLCVRAQRRTVYTNTDRVFTMRFNVSSICPVEQYNYLSHWSCDNPHISPIKLYVKGTRS